MTVHDAEAMLDEFAVGLGAHLERYGFVADEWTFRLTGDEGDTLIVAFQQSELWTDEEAFFFINVTFSLRPKWEYDCVRLDMEAPESPRGGTMLTRIMPDFGETWFINNQATSDHVAEQVRRKADAVLPHYLGLVNRAELLDRLDEIWKGGAWRRRAWIIAQRGPSAELERLLTEEEARGGDISHITDAVRAYALTKT